ncbi:MAG: hypothetical protein RL139_641 [Gemmatimonadota bacterium]
MRPTGRALRWGLLAGLMGYALNLFPLTAWNGTFLFFGGIPVAVAALRLGPVPALAAALVAWLPSVPLIESPFLLLVALGDAAVIGWSRHRTLQGQYLRVTGYWIGVAAPFGWAWYHLTRDLQSAAIAIIVAKNAFNGVAAFGLGTVYAGLPPFLGRWAPRAGAREHQSLRAYLLRASAFGVTLPAVITLLVVVRVVERTTEENQARAMRGMAVAATAALDDALRERVSTIEFLARTLGGHGEVSEASVLQHLEAIGPVSPSFISFLVADGQGRLVAGWPVDAARQLQVRRELSSIADRAYFIAARDSGRTYVSDLFQGRGFGRDRIIAISAPIRDEAGRFIGVAEGSLKADQLGRVVGSSVLPGYDLVVLSASGTIIYGRDSVRAPVLARADSVWAPLRRSEAFRPEDSTLVGVARERRNVPATLILEQTHLVAQHATALGWTVRVERSYVDIGRVARTLVTVVVVLTLAAFLLLRLISLRVLGDVLGPVEQLREAVRPERWRGPAAEDAPLAPTLGADVPAELVTLAHGLDGLKAELRDTLTGLEELVARRTQELLRSVEEARAASQAKTDFLASMSHELRTPLNAVIGSIDALREGVHGSLAPAQRQVLDGVEHSAQHLLTLINDVLDASRLATGRLTVVRERVDVRAVLDRARNTLAPIADAARVQLVVDLPSGGLMLDADPLRLQQVLINLMGNAIRFSRPDGRVTVRVETGVVPGRVRRIQVVDHGIGIPADQLEQIFEPFVQASRGDMRTHGGSGLGLSISRSLCEAMGLALTVASTEGDGATFTVETRA